MIRDIAKLAVALLIVALIGYMWIPILAETIPQVNRAWCKLLNLDCPKPPCVFRMGRGVCIR
jgi:hypothetical protein